MKTAVLRAVRRLLARNFSYVLPRCRRVVSFSVFLNLNVTVQRTAHLVRRTLEPIVLLFGFCSSSWGGGRGVKLQ